ncbi:hypothetical protein V6N11_049588 [Hibiscus sabdariffa]|uniref:Uncharacterized protein n=1 Tax=Hibiscus sabdariffa TaxID=183260 RepID=A0ABR2A4N3_9ROSI
MLLSQSNLLNEPSRITTDRPPDNLAPPVDPGLEGLVRSLVHGSEDRMVEGFVTDHFPVLERLGVLVDAVDLQPAKRDIDGQSLVGNDGVAVSGNVGSLRSYAGVVSNAGKEAVVASVLSLDDVTVSDGEVYIDTSENDQRPMTPKFAYAPWMIATNRSRRPRRDMNRNEEGSLEGKSVRGSRFDVLATDDALVGDDGDAGNDHLWRGDSESCRRLVARLLSKGWCLLGIGG